ncbi:hypothetical protein HK100_003892, partial [Physocladia obscura]
MGVVLSTPANSKERTGSTRTSVLLTRSRSKTQPHPKGPRDLPLKPQSQTRFFSPPPPQLSDNTTASPSRTSERFSLDSDNDSFWDLDIGRKQRSLNAIDFAKTSNNINNLNTKPLLSRPNPPPILLSRAKSVPTSKPPGRSDSTPEVYRTARVWNPNAPASTVDQDRREYHAVESSAYVLPSDDIEQSRIRFQTIMLAYAFAGEIICPPARRMLETTAGVKVLDVGCAQGFWLESLNEQYPNALYYGVDIAQDVLEAATKTKNMKYQFGNVLERLPFPDNTFDYVHQRLLVFGMPKNQYVAVIRELIRVAKPGAWIELVESDINAYSLGPINAYLEGYIRKGSLERNLDLYCGTNLGYYIHQATRNVRHIGHKTVSVPMNWDPPLGKAHGMNMKAFLLGLEDWLHHVMNISRQEYKDIVEATFLEWEEYKTFTN